MLLNSQVYEHAEILIFFFFFFYLEDGKNWNKILEGKSQGLSLGSCMKPQGKEKTVNPVAPSKTKMAVPSQGEKWYLGTVGVN